MTTTIQRIMAKKSKKPQTTEDENIKPGWIVMEVDTTRPKKIRFITNTNNAYETNEYDRTDMEEENQRRKREQWSQMKIAYYKKKKEEESLFYNFNDDEYGWDELDEYKINYSDPKTYSYEYRYPFKEETTLSVTDDDFTKRTGGQSKTNYFNYWKNLQIQEEGKLKNNKSNNQMDEDDA